MNSERSEELSLLGKKRDSTINLSVKDSMKMSKAGAEEVFEGELLED